MKRIWRNVRGPCVILVLYALVHVVFTLALPHAGLISPEGKIDRLSAAATVLTTGFRIAVLFAVVPFGVYRLVISLLE